MFNRLLETAGFGAVQWTTREKPQGLFSHWFQEGHNDNGSWQEGNHCRSIAEIHSWRSRVQGHQGGENLTKKVDASPHHEEQRELDHSLFVLCTFSYNIPPDVAEADNGNDGANYQWHEASKDDPGSQGSVTNWNNKVCLIVIRKTGHTMNELHFKCIWKHNVETEKHGYQPQGKDSNCSNPFVDGLLAGDNNGQGGKRECG